ncbi:MAG: SIS domain-containing protein [Spirochaetes bacterium]|nr:SIS domain-containing protein [Spirochaetota bacterium]MBU1081496.1 SIS domain-containing protein [Spirochaetota bacterium]
MCGIVSLVYRDETKNMGREASELLKRLEYRGYDSTGASFIDKDRNIALIKRVGAPSKVTVELDLPSYKGQRFIGQVRWATYGAVSDVNSQPHRVRCKTEMVGAHNGNISNTDSLKSGLAARGHRVVSDNDGEIIVHLVEDHWAANEASPEAPLAGMRRAYAGSGLTEPVADEVLLIIDAIRKAEAEADGSYAAAVADPRVPGVFAIKSGSSLYAGMGEDENGGFVVVSSDLSSVIAKTPMLIPLSEGEGVWYTDDRYLVFSLGGEARFSTPALKRSRLNVRDTGLDPRYAYYMEQEIFSAPANIDAISRYYFSDSADEALSRVLEGDAASVKELAGRLSALSASRGAEELGASFDELASSAGFRSLAAAAQADPDACARIAGRGEYASDEAQLLADARKARPGRALDLALADLALIWLKRRAVMRRARELSGAIRETRARGGRIYIIASGTSYHAALTAAYFWNGLAGVPVFPCTPGLFRSAYMDCLGDSDMLFAVSQSGETKDLVDILVDAAALRPGIRRVSLVNNENSRIPQELSDFYLPILCGPEIAVAATKSFINQLVVLYILAASYASPESTVRDSVGRVKGLISDTLRLSAPSIEKVARSLFLRPSIHMLGTGLFGLAREGALKIREVALNHTEGYDAAEFKHGPNTILGKNTIFSPAEVEKAMDAALAAYSAAASAGREPPASASALLASDPAIMESLFSYYPLVFVCPPEARDARITISQIHTHKIRGADVFLFAERHSELRLAVEGAPAGKPDYESAYVELPESGDRFLFVFSAAAALQYLAFRMSVIKMEYLDALGVADHGVHPDVPKNVSKSITVD